MPTTTKTKRSNPNMLADYLAGKRTLNSFVFSMNDLVEALRQLLDDGCTSEQDIVSRVRKILRSRNGCFDDLNVVKRALKIREENEPLFIALMRVQQAKMRPRRRRRR